MSRAKFHKAFERQVSGHADQLEVLRARREALQRELRTHPASDYANQPKNRRELKDLTKNPSFDPQTFVKHRSAAVVAFELDVLAREIQAHETIVALGRDARVLEALSELTDNPNLAKSASLDSKAFAESRGIKLPANMRVEIEVRGGRVSLRATYYDDAYSFVFDWNGTELIDPPRPEQSSKD